MEYEIGKRLDYIQEKLEELEMKIDSFLEAYDEREDERQIEEEKEEDLYDKKQVIKNRG